MKSKTNTIITMIAYTVGLTLTGGLLCINIASFVKEKAIIDLIFSILSWCFLCVGMINLKNLFFSLSQFLELSPLYQKIFNAWKEQLASGKIDIRTNMLNIPEEDYTINIIIKNEHVKIRAIKGDEILYFSDNKETSNLHRKIMDYIEEYKAKKEREVEIRNRQFEQKIREEKDNG